MPRRPTTRQIAEAACYVARQTQRRVERLQRRIRALEGREDEKERIGFRIRQDDEDPEVPDEVP